jgi:hypothetical protein
MAVPIESIVSTTKTDGERRLNSSPAAVYSKSGGIGLNPRLVNWGATATSQKTYAPLPDKVVAAKTVFFLNDSGTAVGGTFS